MHDSRAADLVHIVISSCVTLASKPKHCTNSSLSLIFTNGIASTDHSVTSIIDTTILDHYLLHHDIDTAFVPKVNQASPNIFQVNHHNLARFTPNDMNWQTSVLSDDPTIAFHQFYNLFM